MATLKMWSSNKINILTLKNLNWWFSGFYDCLWIYGNRYFSTNKNKWVIWYLIVGIHVMYKNQTLVILQLHSCDNNFISPGLILGLSFDGEDKQISGFFNYTHQHELLSLQQGPTEEGAIISLFELWASLHQAVWTLDSIMSIIQANGFWFVCNWILQSSHDICISIANIYSRFEGLIRS